MNKSDLKTDILPLRHRNALLNRWLKYRLENILPEIIEQQGFDMWIVSTREYGEDPVVMSLLPRTRLSADRGLTLPPQARVTLVFFLREDSTLKRMHLVPPHAGGLYQGVLRAQEGQWSCLRRLVREHNPQSIGVNISKSLALADGLSYSEFQQLLEAVGPDFQPRIRSAERLVVHWLERRTDEEITYYKKAVSIAHEIIAQAFSTQTIRLGVTTADDIAWWMREQLACLGLTAWFHPQISVQRQGIYAVDGNTPVEPGDMLHCDMGLEYLGLATDTQQLAYVLKPGETEAPRGLKVALARGNLLQDLVAQEFSEGRTGNEIFRQAISKAKVEGMRARIHTHPIGFHGHGAGPLVGLWNRQREIKGLGDYEIHENTCYALELSIRASVPEWDNQDVIVPLEETVAFRDGKLQFLDGRQQGYHLI